MIQVNPGTKQSSYNVDELEPGLKNRLYRAFDHVLAQALLEGKRDKLIPLGDPDYEPGKQKSRRETVLKPRYARF
jgi:hypothetical protein